jgi:hypothetical protein
LSSRKPLRSSLSQGSNTESRVSEVERVQERTADRVLIHADRELVCERPAQQLNDVCFRFARPEGGPVFTNDLGTLTEVLSYDVSYQSAQQPEQAISPVNQQNIGQTHPGEHDFGMCIGMGF